MHGWADQRWTLARIRIVIGRRFLLTYTIQGVRKLLMRNGWPCQVPARRPEERNDDAAARWVKGADLLQRGHRPRLIHRPRRDNDRCDGSEGFCCPAHPATPSPGEGVGP
ncbi:MULTISPECIES: winged helix-turn-helix domain-containing protein [unclassified Streptomyces]|uniref:helix-turn-helix domain-containing protein n=1 Tax=unclassified Streptomyces TaxID=2593676 RepID=UPI000FB63014|nr:MULTISPECIES: winged helix-turn-helix domain-containing protein [unclassified Streptomyces]MCX4394181.1 winged helix-turn-helix domain-containing protein [Streptomyces sp. NBC_01767]RPK76450.1 hypothetical protein EES42_03410 [Streptomyces sp. ADI95-17]WSC27911.1 winged helix-turn-helix domain-containing protein [Streptomyces sp. NBC_01768]WSX03787.1 winged helix-turn-helix domain-containing protein [Streptomyces sp. NBC_00987]